MSTFASRFFYITTAQHKQNPSTFSISEWDREKANSGPFWYLSKACTKYESKEVFQ